MQLPIIPTNRKISINLHQHAKIVKALLNQKKKKKKTQANHAAPNFKPKKKKKQKITELNGFLYKTRRTPSNQKKPTNK